MRVCAPAPLLLVAVFVHHVCGTNSSYEGSPCVRDEYNGTCTNMQRCATSLVDLQDDIEPQICGHDNGVPLICCTDCSWIQPINTSYAVSNRNIGILWKKGIKSWDNATGCPLAGLSLRISEITKIEANCIHQFCECIDYIHSLPYKDKSHVSTKVLKSWSEKNKCHEMQLIAVLPTGGVDTKRGDYPFMALLGYGDSDENSTLWLCGGSLISERFILTAAHCVNSRLGPVKYAALGVWKRDEPQELWQKHNIDKIISHPDYRPPSKYHDIALLRTETPVVFTEASLPACLHVEEGPIMEPDDDTYALGWGALGYKKPIANILQRVELKEFSKAECTRLYPKHRHLRQGYNHTTQMCYGDKEKPRDTCEGDSGGPLLLDLARLPGLLPSSSLSRVQYSYTITGVTSAGLPCGKTGGAGLYTRVSAYRAWIEDLVWP